MGDSFTIGRIAGIRIGVNWSWVVVAALMTWTLADGVFPSTNPGLSGTAHLLMALAAAGLFFASLLAHELGHAVQARRDGIEIEGITLWLFGGVAKLKGELPGPAAELRVTAAGPLVSLALGGTFVGVALAGLPEAVDGVAAWLGYVNLALLVFNLLPAVPLDGGRILHALLWRRSGDRLRATVSATRVSRVLSLGLIGAGVAMLVFWGDFGGAWLVFLGWFLLTAGQAEARFASAQAALRGLLVRDVMRRDPVTVPASLTIAGLVDEVLPVRRFTTYPVVVDGRAAGLLPFRSVAAVPRERWDDTTVADCMVPLAEIPVFAAGDPLVDAAAALAADGLSRGLVLEEGRLVGLLSATDVADALELGALRR